MIITNERLNSSALKIFVAGRIDVLTAAAFRKEIAKISADVSKVIFDFREVNYISSAGLRELLICRKKFSNMRIENVSREIFKIFSVTGFQRFIPITQAQDAVPSVEGALNKFVDAENSSTYIHVSFKKFLRDKAIYSADKVAVVCAGEDYTWKEIDRCSTIIASELHKRNVRQGSHVALCGANSINWILTFYAVQKLGAIAVLVNFNLCAKEISSLVDYTNVTHFCYGEMSASINELKNLCGDKIQTLYSFRNYMNFKTHPVVINEFRQIVHEDDPPS